MTKENTKYIRLIDSDNKEQTVRAPDGFSWKPYPTLITYANKNWEYCGALDAFPHYKEVME